MPVKGVSFDELFLYKYCMHLSSMMLNCYLSILRYVDTEELFPVASSTSFFTDMHHLLKVMSIGNVRSACHHRLRFLEEVILFDANLLLSHIVTFVCMLNKFTLCRNSAFICW